MRRPGIIEGAMRYHRIVLLIVGLLVLLGVALLTSSIIATSKVGYSDVNSFEPL